MTTHDTKNDCISNLSHEPLAIAGTSLRRSHGNSRDGRDLKLDGGEHRTERLTEHSQQTEYIIMTVKCAPGSLWPTFANFQPRNNDEQGGKKKKILQDLQDFYLSLTYFAFQKTAPLTFT